MTTTVEYADRPNAAGAPGGLAAGARSRRSMLALTAVEGGRLLRHPAVPAATALGVWMLWRWGEGTAPVLHYADIGTQFALAPLAGAALLATNLAVLRCVLAVVAAVPPAAAARALPVTVAHRVGLHRLIDEKGTSGSEEGAAPSGPPVAPVGTGWGRRDALAQARLATGVAARLIAPAPGAPARRLSGPPAVPRAVVALWLGGQASPQAAEGIRQAVTSAAARFETFVMAHDPADDPFWSVRAGRFALALLDRPRDQIAQTLWRNWDVVTAPETTVERLGEILGIQPPSGTSNPGPGC